MTKEQANEIKKALKKENAAFEANYYDSENKELRIKLSGYHRASEQEVNEKILTVLRAMTKNGFRNAYRTEQRTVTNNYGTFNNRYIIFK